MIEDLFDEEILKPKKKKTIKPTTLILIAIIVLLLLCVLTIATIVYLKGTILTISLDGKDAKELQKILIFEENNKVYIPIRRMANYLKYDSYNGDYTNKSEDTTKCYFESDDELVAFTLNSAIITKVIDKQSQRIQISEPIKEINGELCISAQGAEEAFNFKFYNNIENKQINIETLNYLYNAYSRYYQSAGYLAIEGESYANKTAVLDNMLIVKTENNYYGVISTAGASILENKYDKISYLRKTADFLVQTNGKKGIISKDKTSKIEAIYDSIDIIINNDDIYYKVKDSNGFGLLDVEGKIVIYPEYEQIGIDVSKFEQNGVTNGYIFYNKLVPVKRNNQWGLFDLSGNKTVDFSYNSFGCAKTKNTREYGVLQIPEYGVIVGEKFGKYNVITIEGKGSAFIFDSIFVTVTQGKNKYYAVIGEETKELEGVLEQNGITKIESAQ